MAMEGKRFEDLYIRAASPLNPNAVGAECEGVFAATCRSTGKVFAVKVFKKNSEDTIRKARSQAELMKFIDHPNIMTTRAWFDTPDEGIFLVMDLCQGGDLFDYIVSRPSASEEDVRTIAKQILSGLRHCHYRGIVHHDLKPENILMERPYPGLSVKITDFGFAQLMRTHEEMIERWGGTESYWPPEIWRKVPHNEKSDMWSFGVILFVLLSGKPPFYCSAPRCRDNAQRRCLCGALKQKVISGQLTFYPQFFGHVSEAAKDLMRRILVVEPSERLSAAECLHHRWFTAQGLDTPLPDWLENMRQFNKSRRNAHALEGVFKHKPDLLSVVGIRDKDEVDVLAEGGVQPLISQVVGATSAEEQKAAVNRLSNFAQTTANRVALVRAGCIEQLVRLAGQTQYPDVKFFICITFSRLVEDLNIRKQVAQNSHVLLILQAFTNLKSNLISRAAAHVIANLCQEPSFGRVINQQFGYNCLVNLLKSNQWVHQRDGLAALVALCENEDTGQFIRLLDPALNLFPTLNLIVVSAARESQDAGNVMNSVAHVPLLHNAALFYRLIAEKSNWDIGCRAIVTEALPSVHSLVSFKVEAVSRTASSVIKTITEHPELMALLHGSGVGDAILAEIELRSPHITTGRPSSETLVSQAVEGVFAGRMESANSMLTVSESLSASTESFVTATSDITPIARSGSCDGTPMED